MISMTTYLEQRKNIALNNLEKFPTIKKLFGVDRLKQKIGQLKLTDEEGVTGHGLAWLLSREPLDVSLQELENSLCLLQNEQKVGRLIKKGLSDDQFWQTLSEIQIIARFKKNGKLIEIEPLINGKTPEASIKLGDETLPIEVVTYQLGEQIKELDVGTMKNRMLDKLPEKLPQLLDGTILVINTTHSEIDKDQVLDAIFGTPIVKIPYDSTKSPLWSRSEDGIISKLNLKKLKAVVVYGRSIEPYLICNLIESQIEELKIIFSHLQ